MAEIFFSSSMREINTFLSFVRFSWRTRSNARTLVLAMPHWAVIASIWRANIRLIHDSNTMMSVLYVRDCANSQALKRWPIYVYTQMLSFKIDLAANLRSRVHRQTLFAVCLYARSFVRSLTRSIIRSHRHACNWASVEREFPYIA